MAPGEHVRPPASVLGHRLEARQIRWFGQQIGHQIADIRIGDIIWSTHLSQRPCIVSVSFNGNRDPREHSINISGDDNDDLLPAIGF
jgi:hypothetical protein